MGLSKLYDSLDETTLALRLEVFTELTHSALRGADGQPTVTFG